MSGYSGKSCYETSYWRKKVVIPNSEELLHQYLVFSVAFDEILYIGTKVGLVVNFSHTPLSLKHGIMAKSKASLD